MVELACLENKWASNGSEGSNPSLSANLIRKDFMANIIDFSNALAQEGLLTKKYEVLLNEATKNDNKKIMED